MFFKNSFFRGPTHRRFRLSGRLHVLLHQNQHWDRSPRPCNRHHVRPRQVVPRAHTEPQEESTLYARGLVCCYCGWKLQACVCMKYLCNLNATEKCEVVKRTKAKASMYKPFIQHKEISNIIYNVRSEIQPGS